MIKENNLESVLSSQDNIDISLSYSKVSDFARNGPRALISKSTEDTNALRMGALVDNLLFDQDKFKEIYHISDFNEPTATLGILCKIILTNFTKIPSLEVVTNLVEINELWGNIKKPDVKLEKYNTSEFWGYLHDKFNSIGKIVVTKDEKIKAEETVHVLKTHKFSKAIFDPKLEHFYQYPFTIKIKQFNFRGILDIVTIDHKNKIIYFKDLKTGAGPSSEFLTSFLKYRYYIQEAVYMLAFDEICKELKLKDYTLAPFEFIYIGLKELLPISYIVTPKWHESALNGFKTNNNYKYKGLYELIDEIYFHWRYQVYDLPMNIYKNNGRIELDDNFIGDE